MPALYIPVIIMLLGLVFRGVAFEFRFKASGKSRILWDYAFHFGSLAAAFMQGMYLGAFVQGIAVDGRSFSGGAFDWLTAFSTMTGLALVCGYILMGATWLIMKTDGETQLWARKCAGYITVFVALFMGLVSLSMPFLNENIKALWFSLPNFFYLLPMPLLSIVFVILLWHDIHAQKEYPSLLSEHRPFYSKLHRLGNQFMALDRSIRNNDLASSRRTGVPISHAGRHGHHAAVGARLYRLLLLCLQGQIES